MLNMAMLSDFVDTAEASYAAKVKKSYELKTNYVACCRLIITRSGTYKISANARETKLSCFH